MPIVNNTIAEQLAHIQMLIQRKRQEQLRQDQSDIDCALDNDDAPLGVDNSWSGNHARLVMPVDGDQ